MAHHKKSIDAGDCIHCGLCTKNCAFLEKYHLDIGDTKKLRELAYHCFLCGRCTAVCPKGIDGREIILNMRREQVRNSSGRLKKKGYGLLRWEKENYKFRNYRNLKNGIQKKSVLFPGCNFPSFYPDTTEYLISLLGEECGAGVVFDCCGKPVAELGFEKKEEEIIHGINQRLQESGIDEVIMVCPNCYAFLKPRLKVKVVSIYEKLSKLAIGEVINGDINIFPPCPDRKKQEMLEHISPFLKGQPKILSDMQCCGLGGCAGIREPELADKMAAGIDKEKDVYTYCASCAGNFARKGYKGAEHVLVEILGTKEKPDTGKSLFNRIKTRYWREKSDEKQNRE